MGAGCSHGHSKVFRQSYVPFTYEPIKNKFICIVVPQRNFPSSMTPPLLFVVRQNTCRTKSSNMFLLEFGDLSYYFGCLESAS